MQRPYFSWPIDRLEAFFESNREDLPVLSNLAQELALRKTGRARQLLTAVSTCVAELRGNERVDPSGPVRTGEHRSSRGGGEVHQPLSPPLPHQPRQPTAAKASSPQSPTEIRGQQAEPRQLATSSVGDALPDDRHRPQSLTAIRPPGTPGLPDAWNPPLEAGEPLRISQDADIPQRFAAALTALIKEMKTTGAGQKRYELENGVRIEGNGALHVYEFLFLESADIFEDAGVEIELPGRRIAAWIVSISNGRLRLSTQEDIGTTLHRAVIIIDATALLEALREKIDQARNGSVRFNRPMADAVIGQLGHPPDPYPIAPAPLGKALNSRQSDALQKSLRSSITYIWGPPGTGKTFVLAEVVRAAFDAGKRILIASNTNRAVDQVLYKLCRSLGAKHAAMEQGKIVRLGSVADDKLKDEYGQYVTLDGIVDRRSAALKDRKRKSEEELARLDTRCTRSRHVLELFADMDRADQALDSLRQSRNDAVANVKDLQNKREAILLHLSRLGEELQGRQQARFKIFKRTELAIKIEIEGTRTNVHELGIRIADAQAAHAEAGRNLQTAQRSRDAIAPQLAGFDRRAAKQDVDQIDKLKEPILAELREVDVALADIRASVLREAKILGATCTKTYLAVKEVGSVELVIVDEASMVLQPMIWFAAGLATERVVVCGDFRQLPPIIQTRQQSIFEVIGPDVYEAAKLNKLPLNDARMVTLQFQRRMDDAICQLIAKPMYGGILHTAESGQDRAASPPPPYEGTLAIIDTSELWPFESVNAFWSRFNLMHALLVRNLAWHLHRNGYARQRGNLAICTPYSAQAKLIRKLLEQEECGEYVEVRTVHGFQGDERKTVVLEFPEGHGPARKIGRFLQGIPPEDIGARLLNVAVSRAEHRLIILANLTHLDRHLPSSALLRNILWEIQKAGRVINASSLLALRPIERDLAGLRGYAKLDIDAESTGLFNGATFDGALEVDIRNAKHSVVIFSGFVTPSGVSRLGDLLRAKVSQGVKVRCVTRPPHLNGSIERDKGTEALDHLAGIGCSVDCRARIHEKVIIIDKEIVWHGSLNALSHGHRTDESMTRLVNGGFAQALAANMAKRRSSASKASDSVAEAENPRCGDCGGRTYYDEGRYGPYFCCESKCGWTQNLEAAEGDRRLGSSREFPKMGPECPVCKGPTRLRHGKFGPFYRCAKAPACEGKCPVPRPGGKRTRAAKV